MVTNISRHDHPTDTAAERLSVLDEVADWVLGELGAPDGIGRAQALGTTLTLAKSYCAIDPEAVKFETREAWITAMRTGSALFAAATAAEDSSVTVRIKERERVLPALRAESVVHAGAWTTTWYLAMICRDNKLLTTLAQIPVPLLRESGALFDGYAYRWVETLQSYWLGRQDVGDKLVAAVDAAGPRVVRPADAELASRIVRPSMLLLYRVIRRDPAEFNEALSDALLRHKEYWTSDPDRELSSDGLVALGPLAMACLARDLGISVEVESAYLPKALIEYSRVGEM